MGRHPTIKRKLTCPGCGDAYFDNGNIKTIFGCEKCKSGFRKQDPATYADYVNYRKLKNLPIY
jgi:uncharacterized protein (DUF983 family)